MGTKWPSLPPSVDIEVKGVEEGTALLLLMTLR